MTFRQFVPEGHQEEIYSCFFVLEGKQDGMCLHSAVTRHGRLTAQCNEQPHYIRECALP